MSGIKRSWAQSPPPMTLPARAVASATVWPSLRPGVEKESRKAEGYKLGTGLTVAIRITSAEPIVFTIAPDPFTVLVALVRGDVEHGADRVYLPNSLQQVHRSHDIGAIRLIWIGIGIAHQWLCGHVDNDIEHSATKRAKQMVVVGHVAQNRLDASPTRAISKRHGVAGSGAMA